MRLRQNFDAFLRIDFDKRLAKFKSTFSKEDLDDTHLNVQAKLDNAASSDNPAIKIYQLIHDAIKGNLKHFKEFLSSDNRLEQYSNCRALKEVGDLQMLIKKAYKGEQSSDASDNVQSISTYLDNHWNKYYAICKNFAGSEMESVDSQIIGRIGFFVDGDISI